MTLRRPVLAVLALVLLATPALAHVPGFPDDNTSPDRAVVVPDAAKSWSFYDRLEPGEARYYRLSLDAGQRLRVGTFTPTDNRFTPSVVLMSHSLEGTQGVPAAVTVPEGMGALVLEGARPERASYEPFAPAANYPTVDLDRPVEADTTYLVAVYEPEGRAGPVGVAIGYEERFSPTEYLTVPFDLVRTHLWEGQHPLLVFAPWLVTLGGGLALLRNRAASTPPIVTYGLGGAALVIVGTGVSAAMQTGLALLETGPTAGVAVTAIYVLVPLVAGGWLLRRVLQGSFGLSPLTRAALAVTGVLSLVTWAGFVVAPALVLAVAATPADWYRGSDAA